MVLTETKYKMFHLVRKRTLDNLAKLASLTLRRQNSKASRSYSEAVSFSIVDDQFAPFISKYQNFIKPVCAVNVCKPLPHVNPSKHICSVNFSESILSVNSYKPVQFVDSSNPM